MCKAIADGMRILALICLLPAGPAFAQEARPQMLTAGFRDVATVRYEFDGIVRVTVDHAANVNVTGSRDCAFRLRTVVKVNFSSRADDGAVAGSVHLQAPQLQAPDCPDQDQKSAARAVRELETTGTDFHIHPAGDVRLGHPITDGDPEILDTLLKAVWDVLQPRLAEGPMSAGSPWAAGRRFLYWPDTFVENMDVAASSMRYARDLQFGPRACALLEYKQVFSPNDMPAYTDARSRARDFTGTTYITGRAGLSVLLDRGSQQIVYVHRTRSISNRLMLKYENGQNPELATFAVQEESAMRWLPEQESQAWLAELDTFERSPGEDVQLLAPKPAEHTVAAAAAAQRKPEPDEGALSSVLNRPPSGFERWSQGICTARYCFTLALNVPLGTREAEHEANTTLLLGGSGDRTFTIAIGPVLDYQNSGLRPDELLQQQITRFVANNLWFARGRGELINFSMASLDNRPATFSDFSSSNRDLTPSRGHLVMVIGPYGRLVPVACTYPESQPGLDADCQTVVESLVVR